MRNTADVTGGKPIVVFSQTISDVSAVNPLVAFTTFMEERERCYYFALSRTPHETICNLGIIIHRDFLPTPEKLRSVKYVCD
jgi:hypothetical protein